MSIACARRLNAGAVSPTRVRTGEGVVDREGTAACGGGDDAGPATRSSEAAATHQANKSSPIGPALHDAGGSFCRSISSFCIRLEDDIVSQRLMKEAFRVRR